MRTKINPTSDKTLDEILNSEVRYVEDDLMADKQIEDKKQKILKKFNIQE